MVDAWPALKYGDWSRTCDTLHAHTQSILHSCYRIRENLNAARKQFEQQYLDATNPRGASRLFEQTVGFDPGPQRPKVLGEDFLKWYADQHGASLSQWAGLRAAEVHADVQRFVEKCYEPLTSLTMDDILRGAFTGDLALALRRAGAVATIVAHGTAHLADDAADGAAGDERTRQAERLLRTGEELTAAGHHAEAGRLD